jgi:hypothetical protein
MGAPLLNEYKFKFALNRLLSTLTGFASAPHESFFIVTFYIAFLQTLLFLLPFIASLIILLVNSQGLIFGSIPNIILGILFGLLYLLIQLFTLAIRVKSKNSLDLDLEKRIRLNEDGIELDETTPLYSACKFIFVDTVETPLGSLFWFHVALKAILLGVFTSASSAYLNPLLISIKLDGSSGGTWIVYIFGWFSTSVAQFSFNRGAVPEPNTYKAGIGYGFDQYSRIIHLAILISLRGLESYLTILSIPNMYLLFIYAFFFILWTFGLIPCVSILLNVVIESLFHHLLSAGPFLNNSVLAMDFIVNLPIIAFSTALCVLNYTFEAILLNAIASIFRSSYIWRYFYFEKKEHHSWYCLGRMIVRLLIIVAMVVAIGTTHRYYNENEIHPSTLPLLYTIFTCFAINLFTFEIQQKLVPSLFPILHNPLIPTTATGYLYSTAYQILPFLYSTWLVLSLGSVPYAGFQNLKASVAGMDIAFCFWASILMIRAFRKCWINVNSFGWDIIIVSIIDSSALSSSDAFMIWWMKTDVTLRLLIVSAVKEMSTQFISKIWFWLLSLVHFLRNRKQRVDGWYFYLPAILIISPFTILITSILNAPAMPILGLPLLWMAFPRPKRMWQKIGKIIFL